MATDKPNQFPAIEANIAARSAADEAITLINELFREYKVDYRRAATIVRDSISAILNDAPQPLSSANTAMDDEESREFEKTTMPFGKHAKEKVADVPLSYLLWIDSQPDFRRDLSRYLASDRVQREIEEPMDDE